MPIGYFADIADANDYFDLERLETDAWDALGSGSGYPLKDKAILQAYNRIYYDTRWALPTYSEATAAELEILRKANGEMAYYLAVHVLGGDEDARKGIQAQGVVEAGVVKEKYDPGYIDLVPVPASVISMLVPWFYEPPGAVAVNLGRDQNRSAGDKIKSYP